jgi:hypothetical protein
MMLRIADAGASSFYTFSRPSVLVCTTQGLVGATLGCTTAYRAGSSCRSPHIFRLFIAFILYTHTPIQSLSFERAPEIKGKLERGSSAQVPPIDEIRHRGSDHRDFGGTRPDLDKVYSSVCAILPIKRTRTPFRAQKLRRNR